MYAWQAQFVNRPANRYTVEEPRGLEESIRRLDELRRRAMENDND